MQVILKSVDKLKLLKLFSFAVFAPKFYGSLSIFFSFNLITETKGKDMLQTETIRNVQKNPAETRAPKASKSLGLLKGLQYFFLVLLNCFSRQNLERTPEPFTLTEQSQHVDDYSRAIQSVMILPYVLVLDMVHRLFSNSSANPKAAVDLCCGPGHFTRMISKSLNCNSIIGVDLSEPMLIKAKENSIKERIPDYVQYIKSDVSELTAIASNTKDLVSFMDAAHHMSSLEQVSKTLKEADRIAKPDGLIILIDPVRPKTDRVAKLYHKIAGQAYVDLGLHYFNQDFRDSLYASWTSEELFTAIPRDTNRKWVQLTPFGFPSFQIVIGLPKGREDLFVNQGLTAKQIRDLIPADAKTDWNLLKLTFLLASKKIVHSKKAV